MWARHLELMLGLWLAMSPFIFRHPPGSVLLWLHDFAAAVGLVTLSLVSYWRPAHRAHLGSLALAGWLIGVGWWNVEGIPASPASQNWMTVGWLLAMFAILPSEATRPPETWRHRLSDGDRPDPVPERLRAGH